MGKAKRVRFLDDEGDDSSNQEAVAESRIIDAPKTSEYAFFKKIKKDAGCSNFQVDKDSKSAEFSNPVGGAKLSYTLNSRPPLAKLSSPAERESSAKHYSFVSPLNAAPTKSSTRRQAETLDNSLLSRNVTPVDHSGFFSPTASASAYEGNQYFGIGVFTEKRRKLQQQAVDTLFPELGEGCSEGFHIVSKLLNRLFPKDIELVEQEMDATDHQSTLPISHRSQKEVYLDHQKTSMDLKNESSFDYITPTYFGGISKENLVREREDSLAIYDAGANFLGCVADPQYIRGGQKGNSSFWFPYEKMSTKAFHIEELEEYSDQSEARKREPRNFLLDWDFGRKKEKSESYLPLRDIEDYTYSTSRTSRIGHKEQFIGDQLDETALQSFSCPQICSKYDLMPQICPKYDDLMPYSQSNHFDTQNARKLLEYDDQDDREPMQSSSRLLLEYDDLEPMQSSSRLLLEYDDLEPMQSSSRLSFTPKYLTVAEDSSIPNVLESSSPSRNCEDSPCCITNVFSDRPQHAVKALLLPGGVDIDMAWKCLSFSTSPAGNQLSASYSSLFPRRGDLSTPYLTEREFNTGLQTSNSRKTYVPSTENAFTHEDSSVPNTMDSDLDCHLLIDNSWDEPYITEDDYR